MEREAEATRRMDRQLKVSRKKDYFWNMTNPNMILPGWRGWWSRMEAEGKREKEKQNLIPEWMKSRMRYNVRAKNISLIKNFEIGRESGIGQASKENGKCLHKN